MDIDDIRSAVTVLSLIGFLVLVASTYRSRRLADHAAASRLVFEGDDCSPAHHPSEDSHA